MALIPRKDLRRTAMTRTYEPDKNSATEVRQGNGRKMNLRVLITSLVAVIVLFAIVYVIYGMQPHTMPPV
jgi:hypothetical protein